ncbi:MAG: hypothetical protein KF763_16350 [Cyclobacteriaceae bacterium]|nr:hypothetical protein [Cyclobacteriaceae bacterium]
MKSITIDIINEKALNLLKELEALNLIKLPDYSVSKGVSSSRKKASDYKGIISAEFAEKMQNHIKQSREEWKDRI